MPSALAGIFLIPGPPGKSPHCTPLQSNMVRNNSFIYLLVFGFQRSLGAKEVADE